MGAFPVGREHYVMQRVLFFQKCKKIWEASLTVQVFTALLKLSLLGGQEEVGDPSRANGSPDHNFPRKLGFRWYLIWEGMLPPAIAFNPALPGMMLPVRVK